jgi:hypothetical protein
MKVVYDLTLNYKVALGSTFEPGAYTFDHCSEALEIFVAPSLLLVAL